MTLREMPELLRVIEAACAFAKGVLLIWIEMKWGCQHVSLKVHHPSMTKTHGIGICSRAELPQQLKGDQVTCWQETPPHSPYIKCAGQAMTAGELLQLCTLTLQFDEREREQPEKRCHHHVRVCVRAGSGVTEGVWPPRTTRQ